MNKVDLLFDLLESIKNPDFQIYDSARKAVKHKANFSNFLSGKYADVIPVNIEIVPSLECNFRCPNCTYSQNGSKSKMNGKARLMTNEVFNKIISQLEDQEVKSLTFTGGGEPAFNPLLIEFINKAIDNFDVGIYTNGLLWDKNKIDQLLSLNPSFVRVSVNAGSSLVHSEVFGYSLKGLKENHIFSKVLENIIYFGKRKKELELNTVIGLGFIINEKNFSEPLEIANLLDYLYDKSDGGIDYAAFRPEVKYFENDLSLTLVQPNSELFRRVKKEFINKIIEKLKNSPLKIVFNENVFNSLSLPHTPQINFSAPWSVSFNYDGKLYFSSEHNGVDDYLIGDIKQQNFNQIWYGEKRLKLLNNIYTLPSFKLNTLNDLLSKIKEIGVFTPEEVSCFYQKYKFDQSSVHDNFI